MKQTILNRAIAVLLLLGLLQTLTLAQRLQEAAPSSDGLPPPYFTSLQAQMGPVPEDQPPDLRAFWNPAVQHPSQKLFGLGDASLLRRAAILQLRSMGQRVTAGEIDVHLQEVQQDPVARWRFVPFLLRVTFDALSAPSPDADQLKFRRAFEQYMSYSQYSVARKMRNSWRLFTGQSTDNGLQRLPSEPTYQGGPTMGNILPKYHKLSEFLKTESQNGTLYIGQSGRATIQMVLAPALAANLPDYRNQASIDLGANINATAAAAGLGSGGASTAATVGLVYIVAFGPTTVVALPTAAAAAAGITGTAAAPGIVHATLSPATMLASAGTAASFQFMVGAGIGIAVAFAVLLAMVIADVVKADQYDKAMNDAVRAGPIPVDVYSLVNPKFEYQAGIWYPVCSSGNKGIATFCYQNCPTGFREDGLYCGKPESYGRGGGYVVWDKALCEKENPQGCEQIGAIHYPKCKPGFHNAGSNVCTPDCPTGWEDIGVSCKKPLYDRGVGKVGDPTESVRTANRIVVFSYLMKMLVGDPADSGALTLEYPKTTE